MFKSASEGENLTTNTGRSVLGCEESNLGVGEGPRVTHICDNFLEEAKFSHDDHKTRKTFSGPLCKRIKNLDVNISTTPKRKLVQQENVSMHQNVL